jgi:DNA-binding CsgD family transcriptional regulator
LVWTLIGPVILLATLFISRWIGDLEAFTSGYINETAIRRPPSRLEGVSNFRSQVKVRLVDPTTWTGIVYLAAQFPIGIAAFVGVVVMYSVVGAATFAPLIMSLTDEPIVIFSATFSTATDALIFTPIGILGFIIASHVVLTFSSLHGWWARLMLGSRSTRVSRELAPVPGGDGPGGVSTSVDPGTIATVQGAESPTTAAPGPIGPLNPAPAANLTLVPGVPGSTEDRPGFAPNTAPIQELTAREQEVFMLMAHGDTNADIAEELFISEGTVKTHVKRVLSKLEMRDRTQVVVFAYEQRLVVPNSESGSDTAMPRSASGA